MAKHVCNFQSGYGLVLLVDEFGEGVGVRLALEVVDDSTHEFTPLLSVVFSKIVCDGNDQIVEMFNTTIDVAFLGICDRSEFVFLFDNFGKVPEFRRASHVF
jgi:hypothetical protein